MTLDALIMFLGTFVALLPFLGFPNNWDSAMLLVVGVLLVALGIIVRRRISKKSMHIGPETRTFAEKSPLDLTRHDQS